MTTKLLPLLLSATLLGCSTDTTPEPSSKPPVATSEDQQPPTPTTEPFTHIIATDTEYYTDGPQQSRPPDGTMKAGTKVKVVEEAGSYCRVEAEDGIVGFVAVDVVKVVGDEQ
jgi:hypothetical protein